MQMRRVDEASAPLPRSPAAAPNSLLCLCSCCSRWLTLLVALWEWLQKAKAEAEAKASRRRLLLLASSLLASSPCAPHTTIHSPRITTPHTSVWGTLKPHVHTPSSGVLRRECSRTARIDKKRQLRPLSSRSIRQHATSAVLFATISGDAVNRPGSTSVRRASRSECALKLHTPAADDPQPLLDR